MRTIDPTKEYRTKSGKRVISINIVTHNSCGGKVTYPVKGCIVVREKPWKTDYCIWSADGRYDVVWGNHSELDLVEVTEEQNNA